MESLINVVKGFTIEIVLFLIVAYLLGKRYFITWKKLPPGPWSLPIVGYLPFLGKIHHEKLAELKKKYGNIIGLKLGFKYVVVLNEYSVYKEVLNHPAALNRPEGIFAPANLGIASLNGNKWKEQRRLVLHIMRNLGMGKGPWETLAREASDWLIGRLKEYKAKPMILNKELETTLVCTLISFLYGRKLQPESDKDTINHIAKFLQIALKTAGTTLPIRTIPGLRRTFELLNIGLLAENAESLKTFINTTDEEVKKHSTEESYQYYDDFINLYKAATEKTSKNYLFTDEDMAGNASVLFVGAADSTLSSINILLRVMAKYPDLQKKVHDELDNTLRRDGSVSYDNRFAIPYTYAVVLEAQRFITVVPLTTTRQLLYDIEVSGYLLPKGTWLTGNTYALHNDPNYWKNPDVFEPERFLQENKKELLKNPKSFYPFSSGKRSCIGETVAYMIILVIFTKLMQKFTIQTPPGMKSSFEIESGLVTHLKPEKLCFVERA